MTGDAGSQSIGTSLLLLIIFTVLNAFFAAAEIAVVSLNKNRIEQKAKQGDKNATKLVALLKDPSNFLATIQVGITLVNIAMGDALANSLSEKLTPFLGGTALAKTISHIFILMMLTYISIVFGELYPKRIALSKSEDVAKIAISPVKFLGSLAKPFVWLLSASTNLLGKLTPMKFDDEEPKMTRDEMRYLLENEGDLDSNELDMVQGVFSLDTKVAREVMVPRTDSFMIDINDSAAENIEEILKQIYSRVPVYDEDKDKVIGILHTKNLLKAAHDVGFDHVDIREIIQEPLFVPETIFIDDLLYELKRTQNQMAVLLDEYGGVVGLATLEDLLEEIVGEIDDESDEVEKLYSQIEENVYYVQGRMLIEEFNEVFHTHLEMNDVDTMAGYLLTALGTIPDENEKLFFDVGNITLISEGMEGSRLLLLKVIFHPEEVDQEPEDERRLFRREKEIKESSED